jgi:predicted unusual protein kinase regulating ubiquinone biosynthesis (AarF/ABC1/UbiB family)
MFQIRKSVKFITLHLEIKEKMGRFVICLIVRLGPTLIKLGQNLGMSLEMSDWGLPQME